MTFEEWWKSVYTISSTYTRDDLELAYCAGQKEMRERSSKVIFNSFDAFNAETKVLALPLEGDDGAD